MITVTMPGWWAITLLAVLSVGVLVKWVVLPVAEMILHWREVRNILEAGKVKDNLWHSAPVDNPFYCKLEDGEGHGV